MLAAVLEVTLIFRQADHLTSIHSRPIYITRRSRERPVTVSLVKKLLMTIRRANCCQDSLDIPRSTVGAIDPFPTGDCNYLLYPSGSINGSVEDCDHSHDNPLVCPVRIGIIDSKKIPTRYSQETRATSVSSKLLDSVPPYAYGGGVKSGLSIVENRFT